MLRALHIAATLGLFVVAFACAALPWDEASGACESSEGMITTAPNAEQCDEFVRVSMITANTMEANGLDSSWLRGIVVAGASFPTQNLDDGGTFRTFADAAGCIGRSREQRREILTDSTDWSSTRARALLCHESHHCALRLPRINHAHPRSPNDPPGWLETARVDAECAEATR